MRDLNTPTPSHLKRQKFESFELSGGVEGFKVRGNDQG